MPDGAHRSRARLLAPMALVACALALLAVLAGSEVGGGDSGEGSDEASQTTPRRTTTTRTRERPAPRTTYTVKTGDTLGSIAESTDIDVETLQELNPELDPQALVSGQRIKLRE